MIKTIKRTLIAYLLIVLTAWGLYYGLWGRHLYIVTAYCNCAKCVNIPKYRDNQFASGKELYWGGIAADKSIAMGSKVELVPHSPVDWLAIMGILRGRSKFVVEDRGGKIKGRHIDIFFPKSRGGHMAALQWGVRRMRIKINGRLAD